MNHASQHPMIRAANALVHTFARVEWQQIDGNKWRSSGGRVLSNEAYQRHQQRVKDRGAAGAKPKAGEKPAEGAKPAGGHTAPKGHFLTPDESKAVRAKMERAGKAPKPKAPGAAPLPGYDSGGLLGALATSRTPSAPQSPVKAPALPGGQKLPDPSPQDGAYINAQHTKDVKRFGSKVANFLRSATAGAVGILLGANGLAWGAIAGTALGGPLGLALGTAIGGGIGGKLGAWAGKKVLKASRGKGRLTAMARGAVRAAVPPLAGAAIGGTAAAVLAAPASVALPSMAASGMIGVDAALGFPTSKSLLELAQVGASAPGNVARGVRGAMATSRASARRAAGVTSDRGLDTVVVTDLRAKEAERYWAARRKQTGFAEPAAPAPGAAPADLDPVALIKARIRAMLAQQGKPADILIDDEPILAALALAAQGEDIQQQSGALNAMAEPVRALVRTSRRLLPCPT